MDEEACDISALVCANKLAQDKRRTVKSA